jgi:hypothetical protein
MCTRVTATARLYDTCRRDLREQLGLIVDPASELSCLTSIIGSGQLTLSDLRQLISAPGACFMLSTLAPGEFSRVVAHLEGGSRSALETTEADLQSELAETLAAAAAIVRTAMRDITANAFVESGLELGYAATTHHAGTATRVELRRGHEIVLVGVHDGGNVEFNHSGRADNTCKAHQLQLEQAVQRRGVCLTQRA